MRRRRRTRRRAIFEDRDAASHGLRCMDPAGTATQSSRPTSAKPFPPAQPGKQRLKMKAGRKQGKR
jgi:hypothetical protein